MQLDHQVLLVQSHDPSPAVGHPIAQQPASTYFTSAHSRPERAPAARGRHEVVHLALAGDPAPYLGRSLLTPDQRTRRQTDNKQELTLARAVATDGLHLVCAQSSTAWRYLGLVTETQSHQSLVSRLALHVLAWACCSRAEHLCAPSRCCEKLAQAAVNARPEGGSAARTHTHTFQQRLSSSI